MSDPTDADLEREARALLGEVRDPPAVSPEVKARALARLVAALPPGGPGGGGDGGGPSSPTAAPAAGAGGALARALGARVPAWSLIASFVAGGALVASASRAPTPMTPVAAVATSSASPIVASPVSIAVIPSSASTATSSASASSSASLPPPPRGLRQASSAAGEGSADAALEEERSLLDVARTAVGRGDGPSALRAAEAHAKKFPRGVLAEEREAMIIQALRLAHRDDEARARLDRFRSRYPQSLVRPALEADEMVKAGDAGAL